MDLQEFMQNFVEQFDDMEVENLSAETQFRELDDWSSLVALSVMAMIDEEYDIRITGDEMRGANSILDLYSLVEGKL